MIPANPATAITYFCNSYSQAEFLANVLQTEPAIRICCKHNFSWVLPSRSCVLQVKAFSSSVAQRFTPFT